MNRISLIPALIFCLSFFFTLPSCTNDNPVDPSQTIIQNNVQAGIWRITLFIDSGTDETSHFSGYSFTFGDNNILTSTNGTVIHTGTWSITDSNSNDDHPDDLDFNILFSFNNDFEDLSEDWQILSQSSNRIELTHVSGGNGGTDFLTFEKD